MELFEWSNLLTMSSHTLIAGTHTLTFLDSLWTMYVSMQMNNVPLTVSLLSYRDQHRWTMNERWTIVLQNRWKDKLQMRKKMYQLWTHFLTNAVSSKNLYSSNFFFFKGDTMGFIFFFLWLYCEIC